MVNESEKDMSKILIAEDEAILRDAYVMILRHGGYEVIEAVDGRDTLDKVEQEKPDLLILDMLMPGMTGIEVLQSDRLKAVRAHFKIIAFTNLSDPNTLTVLEGLGVDRYLLKASIQPHMLVSNVQEVLAGEGPSGTLEVGF